VRHGRFGGGPDEQNHIDAGGADDIRASSAWPLIDRAIRPAMPRSGFLLDAVPPGDQNDCRSGVRRHAGDIKKKPMFRRPARSLGGGTHW
jgi:hypothetical protein